MRVSGITTRCPSEELRAAKEAWPVTRTRALLLDCGKFSEAQLDEIEAAAAAEVEQAIDQSAGLKGHAAFRDFDRCVRGL